MSEKKKRNGGNKHIKEKFPVILKELFGSDVPRFDTLIAATMEDIIPVIYSHCLATPVLNHGGICEDIVQDVLVKVLNTSVPQFFCRPDRAEMNTSPDEYWYWVLRICKNTLHDEFNKNAKKDNKERFIWQYEDDDDNPDPVAEIPDIPETPEQYVPLSSEARDYIEDKLESCFNIIMTTGGNVYKPLTWLIQSIFVLRHNMTRIEANDLMDRTLGEKTLFEVFEKFLSISATIGWMYLEPESLDEIYKGLEKKDKSGRRVGDYKFKEVYMAAGAKKSYSDWVNREDGQIAKKYNEDKADKEKTKKPDKDKADKEKSKKSDDEESDK